MIKKVHFEKDASKKASGPTEDQIWDMLAAKRDIKNARFISHIKTWSSLPLLQNMLNHHKKNI